MECFQHLNLMAQSTFSSLPSTILISRNRSRFTVIGSPLKRQKVDENYGVLNASIVASFIEKTVNWEPTTVNGYFKTIRIIRQKLFCKSCFTGTVQSGYNVEVWFCVFIHFSISNIAHHLFCFKIYLFMDVPQHYYFTFVKNEDLTPCFSPSSLKILQRSIPRAII